MREKSRGATIGSFGYALVYNDKTSRLLFRIVI
jgi:hypothetical protein